MPTHTWVTSAGGPLILVPESIKQHWGGVPANYPEDESDYGRACAVEGYVGLLDVAGEQALVLGDMPARTTFLPEHNLLVREIAGDEDDADLPAVVAQLLPQVNWESGPTWTISEPVILFDSVYNAAELEREEHLRIQLPAGNYQVHAGYIEIPSEYLILVQLRRVQD